MIKRALLAASALLIGGAFPAHALPVCYMQLSNGAVYDVGHLCLSSDGVRLVNTARQLRGQSDEIADVIRADQRYEQSRVNNAAAQQGQPYADDQFRRNSQRFWENEVAETGVELNRVSDLNEDIREINDPQYAGATLTNAMQFISNTDALIIDLRNNDGGHPGMVQLLASYFFSEPVHYANQYNRPKNELTHAWTLPYVPGKRLAEV